MRVKVVLYTLNKLGKQMSRIEKSVRVLIAVAIAFVVAALTLGTIIYYSFVDNVRDWLWLLPVSVIVGLSYLAAHIADGGKIRFKYRPIYRYRKWKRRFGFD